MTIAEVTARLIGILDESGCLLDIGESIGDPSRFDSWIRKESARLPDEKAGLLLGVSLRGTLEQAAELKRHRSKARTDGLRALPYAHDGRDVIQVLIPAGFAGDLLVSIKRERDDSDSLSDEIREFDARELRALAEADDFGW